MTEDGTVSLTKEDSRGLIDGAWRVHVLNSKTRMYICMYDNIWRRYLSAVARYVFANGDADISI